MLFAHDTEAALACAAALVNSEQPGADDLAESDADALADLTALDAFLTRWDWTGSRARDDAELDAVRQLRPRLRQFWHADQDDVVSEVNSMLSEGSALPQLVTHGTQGYHLHATASDAPLATRMSVEAAMALADVVRQQQLHRLRSCAASDCTNVLVDLSRNSSRRFCSTACSNRVNVAAFRARGLSRAADA